MDAVDEEKVEAAQGSLWSIVERTRRAYLSMKMYRSCYSKVSRFILSLYRFAGRKSDEDVLRETAPLIILLILFF